MSFPLQKLDFPPEWHGLYARAQRTLGIPGYAEQADNVEFFEGTLRTRGGSQVVNGWGTYTLAGWVANNGSGRAAGQVADASGFRVGDSVMLLENGLRQVRTIFAIVGTLLTFTSTLTPPPGPNVLLYTVRGLGGVGLANRSVVGLHEGKFRDDAQVLLAMAIYPPGAFGPVPWLHVIGAGEAVPIHRPAELVPHTPQTTVDVTWGSGLGGTLTSVQGLQVGDTISFDDFERVVATLNPTTRAITLTVALPFSPSAGAFVDFFRSQATGQSNFNAVFAGFASCLYVAMLGYAPVKYTHISSTTLNAGWTPTSGTVASNAHLLVNDTVLVTDSTTGQQTLRTIQSIAGATVTLTPALPWAPGAGSILRNVKVYRVGIKPPVTAPTPAIGIAGVVSGEHGFRVKFKVGAPELYEAESEASPASLRLTATNQTINLTNIPVSVDPQVRFKDIYATLGGGDGAWYYAATIPNSQTTYTFNMSDAALGRLMRENLDHCPADTLSCIMPWPSAQRLMAIDRGDALTPARVVFSDEPNLETGGLRGDAWPADNFLLIGLDSGDNPIAIAPFFDSQLIFCERSIWRIRGIPPDLVIEPVNYRADNTGIGTFGPRAVVVDQNEVLFPGQDGFYLINRFEGAGDSGFQSSRISREIDALWASIVLEPRLLPSLHATFFRQRRQARVWFPLNSLFAPADALVFHFDGSLAGEPFGWTHWVLGRTTNGVPEPEAEVQAAAVGVGTPDVYYVATRAGAILQMDINRVSEPTNPGLVDYGGWGYDWRWTGYPVAPSGLGGVARGRFLDIAWNGKGTVPQLIANVVVDLSVTAVAALTILPVALSFDYRLDRLNLLARGQYHAIRLVNQVFNTMVEIQRMAYWFQQLPIPAHGSPIVQGEPIH